MPNYRNAPALPCPAFPGSHLVLDADYVFVSGLTAADIPGGDAVLGEVGEETRLVLRELGRLLADAGCALSDTVRADVHLTDLDARPAMDVAYAAFFPADRLPARTCTESRRLHGGSQVEITLIVRRGASP